MAVVANINSYFSELVEDELLSSGFVAPTAAAPLAKVALWSELTNWAITKQSMLALGLDAEAAGGEPFGMIGLATELCNLAPDILERRRRLLEIIRSAMKAHCWNDVDQQAGHKFMHAINKAVDDCHTMIPELLKKCNKKKKAAGQSSGIAVWQEPSSLVFEFALQQPNSTCALHLSNLQRFPLTALSRDINTSTNMPRALTVDTTRELYIKLSQAQVKVEEALSKFANGHLIIWAPENKDQIPRLLGGVNKLYTEKGMQIQLTILVPFQPLPECDSAESILDLWTHPLLQPKYSNMVKEVCFVREPSRCVFTRQDNPYHTNKSLVAITVVHNSTNFLARTLSMRSMLLDDPVEGDEVLVDVPAKNADEVLRQLNRAGTVTPGAPTHWILQGRSRGGSGVDQRSIIAGKLFNATVLEAKAAIAGIRSCFSGQEMIIGRRSMFVDSNTIVVEGSVIQLLKLSPVVSECVMISPFKALVTPGVSAAVISHTLTDDEALRSVSFRYRKSCPLKGGLFARPKDLASHLQAERHSAFASRLGGTAAVLLNLQMHIEVLGFEASMDESLGGRIMNKIGEETNTTLTESQEVDEPLVVGEWRKVHRDGSWTGKIVVQCACDSDVTSLFSIAHGRVLCVGGVKYALHITSLSNAFLPAQLLEQRLSQSSTSI